MRRRAFLVGLGAAGWAPMVRAQTPAKPVIGFLGSGTAGVRFPMGGAIDVSAQLSHVYYFERSLTTRSRDQDGQVIAPANPSRSPDAAGDYSQSVTLMTLGVETHF